MDESKVSFEQTIELIRKYMRGEISIYDGAKEANVSKETFRVWVKRYEVNGITIFLPNQTSSVYSEDLKLKAVHSYLSGEGSQVDICLKYGIKSKTQLQNWIKRYNAHEDLNSQKRSGGGSYMKQGRETTQEERIRIVKDCLASGKNYGEMAKKYNVSYQQARTWTLRYEELGASGLEDRRGKRKMNQTPRTELEKAQIEIEQLKHKLYLAEVENTLLKKLDEVERRDASQK